MGNSHNKGSEHRNAKKSAHSDREGQAYTSQFSLSQFVGNLSGRSLASVASAQSTSSAARPWSRVSRRRWNDSTLRSPLEASKTAWPVAHKESIFLPEFPISTDLLQKDFEIREHIAKGAFGEVCRVVKLSVNKEYALKVLHKSQIISENAVRQVKQESHIQQVCGHHPALVAAAARWQTKKRLYILSEYIPGGELLALLDKYGKLPEELVKLFVAEIAIAIVPFTHRRGEQSSRGPRQEARAPEGQPAHQTSCTTRGSSTATSSPRTFYWTRRYTRASRTSASPSGCPRAPAPTPCVGR